MIVKERKKLFDFQCETVRTLLARPDKHFVISGVGSGKSLMAIAWAFKTCEREKKNKVLIVSTKSKTKTTDFQDDADALIPEWRNNLVAFELCTWDLLYKWVDAHKKELSNWVFVIDECFKGKTSTSRRGRAFQKVAQATKNWIGFTATPGDVWNDYQAYFQACGLVKNKTQFVKEFCKIQTFKGFPEIVGYYNEDKLKQWWAQISYAPNTSKMLSELPKASYNVVAVSKPKGYSKVLKMRQKLCSDGETPSDDWKDIIENSSQLTNYLRQMCFTNEKKQWFTDFLEGLGEQAFVFYNYVQTGDKLENLAKKVLPKDAKVWRIDGRHHEIPTKETMGPRDIVLAQWQSGAEGLNAQFMRVMVIMELQYSYATHHQGKGRINRIGQERPMFYYLLLAKGTIEEHILKCIQGKRDFSAKVWLLGQGLTKGGE